MKTADFQGEITPNDPIAVPHDIAAQVPLGEKIAVVIRWGVVGEETAWRVAGRPRFEAAYSTDDSV